MCKKEQDRSAYCKAYYEKHKSEIRAYASAWKKANKNYWRIWREKNKEKNKEKRHIYYEANREKLCAQSRAFYPRYKERSATYARAYYITHRGERQAYEASPACKERVAVRLLANRETILLRKRKYNSMHKEQHLAWSRANKDKIHISQAAGRIRKKQNNMIVAIRAIESIVQAKL